MITQPKGIVIRSIVCIVILSFALFLAKDWWYLCAIIVALIACCICIVAFTLYKQKQAKVDAPSPQYKTKDNIVSSVENEFYQKLVRAVPNYTVMQQVPLSNIIDKVSSNAFRNELFRVVDFCIVERATYKPKLLIELNDASHNKADRALRDQKVKAICDVAKINLIFLYTSQDYDINTLSKIVKKGIKKKFSR